jgi:ATP-dependent Lon protease
VSHLNISIQEKQQLFEILDVKKRISNVIEILDHEASIIGVEKRIRGRVRNQMEKTQREYYLNEQLKQFKKNLVKLKKVRMKRAVFTKLF